MLLKKIYLIVKIILNSKIYFYKPKYKDIIIFDGESFQQLQHVLKGFKYFVLETRFSRINKFYITKEIILNTIKNYNKNLLSSYLITLIDQIRPKIVFTYIDNNYRFSEFSKLKNKKYEFVALQNGARYEHKIINKLKKKKINLEIKKFNIPEFLCFGEHEIKDYKKNNQLIKNFTKVGSLKLSNYFLRRKKRKNSQKNIDLLLISDVNCWDSILNQLNLPIEQGIINLIKYTIRFAIKNNLTIKIAARSYKNDFWDENNFYKQHLNEFEYKYLLRNIFFRPKDYKTYEIMEKSKVVIGTMSTMLRENLFIGGKTLACNFTKTDIFDFPIKGICFFKNCDFDKFEKRLDKIIRIKKKTYFNLLDKNSSYLVYKINKQNTIKLVKLKLKSLLKL